MSDATLEALAGTISLDDGEWVLWEAGETDVAYDAFPTKRQAEAARKALAKELLVNRIAEKLDTLGWERLLQVAEIAKAL